MHFTVASVPESVAVAIVGGDDDTGLCAADIEGDEDTVADTPSAPLPLSLFNSTLVSKL